MHLRQSIIAIILGFVLSLPLGWLAWRYRAARGGILTVTGLLYTIPSLALLPILPVLLGTPIFSEINLILALTIYAIALMVRSVADGLGSVDHLCAAVGHRDGVRRRATVLGRRLPARRSGDPRGAARHRGEHDRARHGRRADRRDQPRLPLHERLAATHHPRGARGHRRGA